ncbi:hypothetical protein [Azospirillum brasilense]|uniref:hypothetical protein n=1 Tax=Azospirillum brasilense TaxID=192 RepID=UPI0011EFE7CE|nr:hypothetical protein [Azospirillum brasilense]
MRCQEFLNNIKTCFERGFIDYSKFREIAAGESISGGWEVWLQLEIAYGFLKIASERGYASKCSREEAYPSQDIKKIKKEIDGKMNEETDEANEIKPYISTTGPVRDKNSAARADFLLKWNMGIFVTDDTYVELKCINQSHNNPVRHAWKRFEDDIIKQTDLLRFNSTLNCISVLVSCGSFTEEEVRGDEAELRWLWEAGKRDAYVYDMRNERVSTLKDVRVDRECRPFFIAVAINNLPEYRGPTFTPELWSKPLSNEGGGV